MFLGTTNKATNIQVFHVNEFSQSYNTTQSLIPPEQTHKEPKNKMRYRARLRRPCTQSRKSLYSTLTIDEIYDKVHADRSEYFFVVIVRVDSCFGIYNNRRTIRAPILGDNT